MNNKNDEAIKYLAKSYMFKYIWFVVYIISLALVMFEFYKLFLTTLLISIICVITMIVYEFKFMRKILKNEDDAQ